MGVLPQKFDIIDDRRIRRVGARRPGPTAPNGATEGDVYYNTSSDKLFIWNGSAWVQQIASGAWDTWATAVAGITNTTNVTRWTRFGRTIIASFRLTGTGATVSSGRIGLTMPVLPEANRLMSGGAYLLDGGAYEYACTIRQGDGGGGQIMFMHSKDGLGVGMVGDAGGTLPFTFGNTDVIQGTCTYEAAASV